MFLRILTAAVCATSVFGADHTANRLRKDVYYLASDKLKGRGGGTPELEAAAEFIAQRFWKLGLHPASAMGWFQAVPIRASSPKTIDIRIEAGTSNTFALTSDNASALNAVSAEIASAGVVKLTRASAGKLKPGSLEGQVVVATEAGLGARIAAARPLLAVIASGRGAAMASAMPPVIMSLRYEGERTGVATVITGDPSFTRWAESLTAGPVEGATASGGLKAERRQVDLRNVIGVLRGSDPVLRDTYVIVSAHYDHLGETPGSGKDGDRIRNGANDDASGTATMLAIAQALTKSRHRPKRSVVFAAWTGEEAGGLGSQFYGRHPLLPLAKTVANVNIEQNGRYDGEGGAGPKRLLVTGYNYSDVGKRATEAAKAAGIEVAPAPDEFFERSDNYFLARFGVPAHTFVASLEFPDYHTVSDSAEKLDYENMALLTRAITAVVADLANSATEPQWNQKQAETAPYRKARVAAAGAS